MASEADERIVDYRFDPLGEAAVTIVFGQRIEEETYRRVSALTALLEERPFIGMMECVPAFASVTVHYNPFAVLSSRSELEQKQGTIFETVCTRIQAMMPHAALCDGPLAQRRTIEIPVCYGGDWGPDLGNVAKHNGLSEEEVIAIHTQGVYLVYMIGFAPGFPYLGGMSRRIAAPRHQTPRMRVPNGSVGIAGEQTGVYPLAMPGGWQLIGRTPLTLFQPESDHPSLLSAGDQVTFKAITREQYEQYRQAATEKERNS